MLSERVLEMKKKLYVIDYTKAFDNVKQKYLERLEKLDLLGKDIQIMHNLNCKTGSMRIDNELKQYIKI